MDKEDPIAQAFFLAHDAAIANGEDEAEAIRKGQDAAASAVIDKVLADRSN
jgi:hypothetical protein